MLMRPMSTLNHDFSAIKTRIDNDWNSNQSVWEIQKSEAAIDTRLEAGDSSLSTQLMPNLPYSNQNQVYFNRVRPMCSQVSGAQRNNRKSSIVIPIETGDQKTADQWSKVLLNLYKKENVYETISDAFYQGPIITGLSLLHIYLDFTDDPVFGDIKVVDLPYNAFYVDPNVRRHDLSDARFVTTRTYVSHGEAALLLPAYYEEVMALQGTPPGMQPDQKYQFLSGSFGDSISTRLAYDEYYYRDYTNQKKLIDKKSGESLDITYTHDKRDLKRFLQDNPYTKVIDQQIPTTRLAIQVQGKVFYDGPQPLGIHDLPFVAMVGYFNPGLQFVYERFQGLCRAMRSPQMLLNRRIMLNMDISESIVNSGFFFKEEAIKNVKDLFQTGPGRMIPIKKGSSLADIAPIPAVQIPPAFFQIEETLQNIFPKVTGITEEVMGFETDDKSGYSRALSQGAGQTTLKPLFDKLDFAQNLLATKIMKVIRANYGPQKIKLMLGGEEPEPLFYNKAFGRYHAMVELGFNTESQRQMQFAQILKLREVGVPIPASALIEAATIQNKTKIIEAIEAEQKAQSEQAQNQMQAQQQLLQMQAVATHSKALSDRSLAAERDSRIPENRAFAIQRLAESNKQDEEATLNKVKALKELEEMDLTHIQRLIEIAQMLKESEKVEATQQETLDYSPEPSLE